MTADVSLVAGASGTSVASLVAGHHFLAFPTHLVLAGSAAVGPLTAEEVVVPGVLLTSVATIVLGSGPLTPFGLFAGLTSLAAVNLLTGLAGGTSFASAGVALLPPFATLPASLTFPSLSATVPLPVDLSPGLESLGTSLFEATGSVGAAASITGPNVYNGASSN